MTKPHNYKVFLHSYSKKGTRTANVELHATDVLDAQDKAITTVQNTTIKPQTWFVDKCDRLDMKKPAT